jgi:hypothetical protein
MLPPMLRNTFGLFLVALLLTALTNAAAARPADRAPSPEEQKIFEEGMRLMQAGDAGGAARAFKAGYDAGHDPAFLVRLGEANEKAGAAPAAVDSYRQYLRESPDAADRDDIEARLQRLAPAPVVAKPTSQTAEAPLALPQPGAPAANATMTAPPAPAVPRAPAAAAPAVSPAPQFDEEESLRAFRDDDPTPRTRLDTAAWIGTGVTVALLGVAAFYGAKAGEKASDVDRLTSNFDPVTGLPVEYASVADRYAAAVRDGKHDDRMAKGFAIAAGATALTSAALFIIDAVRHPASSDGKLHAAVLPTATSHSAGMDLSWTF